MDGVPEWAKRRQVIGVAIAVVAVAGAIGVSQWQERERDTDRPQLSPVSSMREVVYYVEGADRFADITMQTPTGTSQITAELPLRRKSDGSEGLAFQFRSGEFVYLAVQKGDEYGPITCRITVNGDTISENTLTVTYGIATCEGIA